MYYMPLKVRKSGVGLRELKITGSLSSVVGQWRAQGALEPGMRVPLSSGQVLASASCCPHTSPCVSGGYDRAARGCCRDPPRLCAAPPGGWEQRERPHPGSQASPRLLAALAAELSPRGQ